MTDSNDQAPPPAAEPALDFERAEFAAPEDAAPACALCKHVLGDEYFTVNAVNACDDCHHLVSTQAKESKSGSAFVRAFGFGAAAAVGGSIAWYAVARITGMEIGLLAIAVGWAVGKAVRHGARGPGGRRYQALAMLLTYLSITGAYAPLVAKSLFDAPAAAESASAGPGTASAPGAMTGASGASGATATSPASVASAATGTTSATSTTAPDVGKTPIGFLVGAILVIGFSLAAPFLSGVENILGIVMIAIALYEAWKFNRRVPLVLDGPFRTRKLRRASAPMPPAVAASVPSAEA